MGDGWGVRSGDVVSNVGGVTERMVRGGLKEEWNERGQVMSCRVMSS